MSSVEKTCAQCGTAFLCDKRVAWRKKYCSKLCRHRSKLPACKTRYLKNRGDRIAKMRAYHAATRDARIVRMREKRRQTRLTAPWKHIMDGAKHRAKVANLPFDLTDEWARSRWTGRCELSGIEFALGLKPSDKRMFAASIDRIDATKGYTRDNCRFILFAINCMRQDGDDEAMFSIALALVRNVRSARRIA